MKPKMTHNLRDGLNSQGRLPGPRKQSVQGKAAAGLIVSGMPGGEESGADHPQDLIHKFPNAFKDFCRTFAQHVGWCGDE